MRKHVTAYLHTHWDREWYREYEIFRMRLLRVFDNVLDLLAKNKIPSFYFDGQVSALEDYLEIRPENRELVETLIRHKKLFIGPFYCLVDEFLTDKKCFSKNLETGIKIAEKYGCKDFIGYLPDTFGHSQNVVEILRDYGIDKCIVWRGCGDFPSEFRWCGMDTVNLVRGYFNDFFSMKADIRTKTENLKKNLDLIAEKSSDNILLPIGADHLGVETDISEQIDMVNELLKDSYYIKLASPFEYIRRVQDNFSKFEWNDELRDNSKTFTLQGCYSSRLDLKKANVVSSYKLDLADRFTKYQKDTSYDNLIEYGYKMLLQNQAHDSICGCSTADVHRENEIRYKKINQIADGIIDELKYKYGFSDNQILNLSDKPYTGIVEFETSEELQDFDLLASEQGFEKALLADTQSIPITEDYKTIYKYASYVYNLPPGETSYASNIINDTDLSITGSMVQNSKIKLEVLNNQVYINNVRMQLVDFIDMGDSYNNAPVKDDNGTEFAVRKSRIIFNTNSRAILRIEFESEWDFVYLNVSLDKFSSNIKLVFDWENTRKNHLLCVKFNLDGNISEVYSEDMNTIIKRTFDPDYNIRDNLPKTKGIEVKTNTAPMQRGLFIDSESANIGVVTKGLTQYDVYQNKLYIPILRATGLISNPQNPARTTPAGPPLEVDTLQQIGKNTAEMYVFFGNQNDFEDTINQVYNYLIT